MSKAFKCDKCGQVYEFSHLPQYTIITSPGISVLDLCPKCSDALGKWINGDVQMIAFKDSKANITTDAGNAQLLAEKIIKQVETNDYRKVAP